MFLPYSKNLFEKNCQGIVDTANGNTKLEFEESDNFNQLVDKVTEEEIRMVMEKFTSKAKSASGLSPKDLKDIGVYLAPYLAKIFTTVLEGRALLPEVWMESAMVFMFKAGDKQDPCYISRS